MQIPLNGAEESKGQPLTFNRDIRPILSNACFQCHGPDEKTREAELRLDEIDSARANRGGYAAILPGQPHESEMIRRILSEDREKQMPPPDSGLKISSEEKKLLNDWILQGAEYEKHWAFTRVARPAIPKRSSVTHPIDFFIQAKLVEAGLVPSKLAPPETQLRRVTLDLTGVPPSLEEIDNFLSDVEKQGLEVAYSDAIDRLFTSQRYGERMAWPWMEAARYADTDGYQNDGHRDMWRWRDWVIEAFNRNMPFDQFTIEQLAGDLLPNPTHEQLIATAFNRNNRYNSEEGIPIDEFLLENAVDRVDTTATVWMGLTAGCARCHDHKFDPITQREYYQLIDYFNDVAESGRAVKVGNSEPWIKTPTNEQRVKLAGFDARIQRAMSAIAKAEEEISQSQLEWERSKLFGDAFLTNGLDHRFSFDAPDERLKPMEGELHLHSGIHGNGVLVSTESHIEIGKIDGLIGNGRYSIAFWMQPIETKQGPILSNEAPGTGRNGILVEFIDGRLRWNNITRWISGVSTIETKHEFQSGEWVHVVLTNDGTQRAAGMIIYVNGQRQEVNVIRNTNSNAAQRDQGVAMSIGFSKHLGRWQGTLDELRFYTHRTISAEEATLLAVRHSLFDIAKIPSKKRTLEQKKLMRLAFMEQSKEVHYAKLLSEQNDAVEKRTAYYDSLPTTMVMQDLPIPRPSHVRLRGVYDALGQKVEQGVPEVFPPLPADEKNSRLAFARWLVSREHPLTARVTVNRFWQMLFGAGLVRTTEDFGSQGESPSHPELLDWLAVEFMESGWDIRAIVKTMVTSHTYRQSSEISMDQIQADPENRLLARSPRMRLTGNILRDQALFVSGLLVEKVGGPSVFPYQPAKLWEEASNAKYKEGKGDDLYRRSLYTYWKRTLAPPTMAVLDSADRESCAVRPKVTNTPLQALTLMNDVTFVEAARKLGERIVLEAGNDDHDRVAFGFRLVTGRKPSRQEAEVLVRGLRNYRDEFAKNPKNAELTLSVGESEVKPDLSQVELAAATALANVLLNLEEATTRE